MSLAPGARLGPYEVTAHIGAGGMGEVWRALDTRLGRPVALKLIRDATTDPDARARLEREARLAASVSHPAICQVYELAEIDGQLVLAMELLKGAPLAARLGQPLPPAEAVSTALTIIGGLGALHERGIVHRDLKPSNIFITPHGVKLLDFGLARPVFPSATDATLAVTENGIGVGTPLYAAPEQLLGRPFDVRADVYSLGAILFEMLTGRPPFSGATLAELIHAVVHEPPPVLAGSPAVWALDRVVRRALAKAPSDRYLDIASFADALSPTRALLDGGAVTEARAMTRLAVLPFRLLRTDPEIEYLSLSLADVIANALSGLESLVVRSSLSTAKYATGVPDLGAAARELSVDVVLTGTVLRSHNRLRVSAQLMSAPAGDMLWSHTLQVDMDTIFELHDELAQRVIQSLPLTRDDVRRGPRLRPTSAKAFDLYMRGMQLRMEAATWRRARDLFDQCLGIDAGFAPAWAERGRLDRVLAKYQDSTLIAQAESALQRALELDPDSGPAHYYRAQLEIDTGRPDEALMRLVKRAAARHVEPQVYAGLVHACRYCGLLRESVSAHQHARRLDPTVSTSVLHTYYVQRDYDRALEEAITSSDPLEARVLGATGRDTEAIEAARREEARFAQVPRLAAYCAAQRAAFEGRSSDVLAIAEPYDSSSVSDGEDLFHWGEICARAGLPGEALTRLERAADWGYMCSPAYEGSSYLVRLHGMARFAALLERVHARQRAVAKQFTGAGGLALLS